MPKIKEMDNAIKINLMMDEDMIEKLDILSEKTRISRSKLIRISCDILIRLVETKALNKEDNVNIVNIITPYVEKWYYDCEDGGYTSIKADIKKLNKLISYIYGEVRIALVNGSAQKLNEIGILRFVDKPEINNSSRIIDIVNKSELNEKELQYLEKVIRQKRKELR